MKHLITNLSIQKAALMVGISFIIMFILGIFADAFVLKNLVFPGNVIEILGRAKRQLNGLDVKTKSKILHSFIDDLAIRKGYDLKLRKKETK